MKFFLIENKQIDLNPPFKSKKFSIHTSITSHPNNANNPLHLSDFKKFKRIFEQKYETLLETCPLNIDIIVDFLKKDKKKEENLEMWEVTIQGAIITALHDILLCGNEQDYVSLDMELIMQKKDCHGRCNQTITVPDLFRCMYGSDDEPNCLNKYGTIIEKLDENTSTSDDFIGGLFSTDYYWYMSLIITEPNFICLADIVPAFSDTNRKLLEEKIFCDFELYTDGDNSNAFPCHKAFLCANSPIFTKILKNDFKEASQNRMKITDISAEGVEALLKFLYYSDVASVTDSSKITLELMKVGDKFGIQSLSKVVTLIMIKMPHYWFDVDMALSLFEVLRNMEASEDKQKLMKKVIQVMAHKSEELSKSKMYMEIFSNPIARDMFKLALATNKP